MSIQIGPTDIVKLKNNYSETTTTKTQKFTGTTGTIADADGYYRTSTITHTVDGIVTEVTPVPSTSNKVNGYSFSGSTVRCTLKDTAKSSSVYAMLTITYKPASYVFAIESLSKSYLWRKCKPVTVTYDTTKIKSVSVVSDSLDYELKKSGEIVYVPAGDDVDVLPELKPGYICTKDSSARRFNLLDIPNLTLSNFTSSSLALSTSEFKAPVIEKATFYYFNAEDKKIAFIIKNNNSFSVDCNITPFDGNGVTWDYKTVTIPYNSTLEDVLEPTIHSDGGAGSEIDWVAGGLNTQFNKLYNGIESSSLITEGGNFVETQFSEPEILTCYNCVTGASQLYKLLVQIRNRNDIDLVCNLVAYDADATARDTFKITVPKQGISSVEELALTSSSDAGGELSYTSGYLVAVFAGSSGTTIGSNVTEDFVDRESIEPTAPTVVTSRCSENDELGAYEYYIRIRNSNNRALQLNIINNDDYLNLSVEKVSIDANSTRDIQLGDSINPSASIKMYFSVSNREATVDPTKYTNYYANSDIIVANISYKEIY